MSIHSIIISRILPKYTAEYIANVLWDQNISQVKSITLLPYLQGSRAYQTAYVSIESWTDCEIAYNFIQRLKDTSKETRIVYDNDYWWPVRTYTRNTRDIRLGPYTTTFPERYFFKTEVEDKKRIIDESTSLSLKGKVEMMEGCDDLINKRLVSAAVAEERVIEYLGIPEQYMTVKNANARLDFLRTIVSKLLTARADFYEVQRYNDELEFLEDQLFSIKNTRKT